MYPQENCVSDTQSTELAEIRTRLAAPVTRDEFESLTERVETVETLIAKVQASLMEAMENPMIRQMMKNMGLEI